MTLEPAKEALALCVNSSLIITCTTPSFLVWRLIPTTEQSTPGNFFKVYDNGSSLEDVDKIGDFLTRLQSKDPVVSTVTLDEVYPKHNGSVLMCACDQALNLPTDEFARITILVKGNLLMQSAMRDYPEQAYVFQ